MQGKRMLAGMLLATTLAGTAAAAEDTYAEDRKALIQVFREIEAGINDQNVDRMVAQMAPEATVTWLNAEVSRGHAQIKAYYHRMVKGENRILDRYTTAAKLGASARFYGNGLVAVADGTMADAFFPVARGPFRLDSNWTSTSVKIDGQWKVVSMHLSSNVFTNSLLDEAKQMVLYAGGGGALGGLVLAWVIGRLRRRA